MIPVCSVVLACQTTEASWDIAGISVYVVLVFSDQVLAFWVH